MRAACGKFGAQEAVEPEGWGRIQTTEPVRPRTNRFVVRASGASMEEKIHDGQLCVFEFRDGTCRENDIVLAQHIDIQDDDTDGAYTIKKFTSERVGAEYKKIVLKSLNPDYPQIESSDAETIHHDSGKRR